MMLKKIYNTFRAYAVDKLRAKDEWPMTNFRPLPLVFRLIKVHLMAQLPLSAIIIKQLRAATNNLKSLAIPFLPAALKHISPQP